MASGFKILEEDPTGPIATPKAAGRGDPLTNQERFIIQNVFDTQPAKRAEYLKQLGFALNPKNENEYRPLGSQGSFAEIDPGVSAYFKKGGLKEIVKDLGDVTFDIGASGPAMAAGAGLGALSGAAVGNVPGGFVGGILGGAAGNAAAEQVKQFAADVFLDKEIPTDYKLMALQSAVAGVAPKVVGGALKLGAAGVKTTLNATKNAIVSAIKSTGGQGITQELLDEAVKNPGKFSSEAVKGATKALSNEYKSFFGVTPDEVFTPKSTREIKPGSVFGDALKPLNEAATAEIDRLAKDPKANWKVSEILDPINKQINTLANKFDRTSEENAALSYLKEKRSFINGKFKVEEPAKSSIVDQFGRSIETPQGTPRAPEINFKEGRQFLKAIQDDAFDREVPGSSFLKTVIGGGRNGLREVADQKASALGSSLPDINAKRSNILNVYNTAKQTLTPQKVTAAFVGNDNVSKIATKETMDQIDQALGTNLAQNLKSGVYKSAVENMYQAPKSFGSGSVNTEIAKGALGGATKGASAGALVGLPVGLSLPAAAIGGVAGAVEGGYKAAALANPARAFEKLATNQESINAVDQFLAKDLGIPVNNAASALAAKYLGPEATTEQAIVNTPPIVPVKPKFQIIEE